jgi:hypothetical protein
MKRPKTLQDQMVQQKRKAIKKDQTPSQCHVEDIAFWYHFAVVTP